MVDQRSHVSFQTAGSINRSHGESQLDVVLRICANNEVDVGPVCEEATFDVTDNVWQSLSVDTFEGLVCLRSHEITVQLFGVIDPPSSQDFKSIGFIRVVFAQKSNVTLLVILGPHVTLEWILMLILAVLKWVAVEWLVAVQIHLLLFC